MKVIVAHPGKQHSYKLVSALSELGIYQVEFCTSIAFQATNNNFLKRFFGKRIISTKNVKIKRFPLLEIFRIIGRRIFSEIIVQYYFERMFDLFASKWLKKQEFDIFIGYECSSYLCLKICNEKKKTGILDLAQIHYKELELLGKTYNCLNYLLKARTRTRINNIKEEEYKLAKYIFSISSFVKSSLIKNNICQSKIFDLPIGHKMIKPYINKINSTEFKIIYVGSIRDQKGVNLLIQAIDLLNNYKIKLTLIGQINEAHYHKIIRNRNYIEHIPYIPNELLNQYYQQCNIFVLPSYLDSWGMVVIEAMSNGLPIIITENCGAKDAIIKGGGIIVKPDNILEIKNAIEYYLLNDEKRKIDGILASEIALEYSFISYRNNISNIIRKIT